MKFKYRSTVKGNQYGREAEVYECEDCINSQYAQECKKTDKDRIVRLNRELTAYNKEVIDYPESIQGALLPMNRSIQSGGTFGIIKYGRWHKKNRTKRSGTRRTRDISGWHWP